MTPDPQLFDFDGIRPHEMHRRTDPEGSRTAAMTVTATGAASSQREAVYAVLRACGVPLTSKDVAGRSGGRLDRFQSARRLPELARLGLVERCGKQAGSSETLWCVKPDNDRDSA